MEIDLKNAQELDPNKTYLFCFYIGDIPKTEVAEMLRHVKTKLEEKNIKQIICVPIFKKGPKITVESISEDKLNKPLKDFLKEKSEGAE